VPADRVRCSWALTAPELLDYHDQEWGRPLHGRDPLFERLSLEAFQSGLSWLTILRKRPAFRAAFAGFDVDAVAAFGPDDEGRLLGDAAIVRNRAKIAAVLSNARIIAGSIDDLDSLLWSFAPTPANGPAGAVRATSPESVAMSKALKARGLRFLGPTTCYALMQAAGMVNDHAPECWLAADRAADFAAKP
jgi:DNA-3-methyladenine glycosylase I